LAYDKNTLLVERYVVADLVGMQIHLKENGNILKSYPIKSKGLPGSYWETPGGIYKVLEKEGDRYSTMGNVYMPWSMQIFGNYFIHGWPYYKDGHPVPEGYSGGCIRLDNESAKEIYEFVHLDTKIVIMGDKNKEEKKYSYLLYNNPKIPTLSSKNYVVSDLLTGETVLSLGGTDVKPIASISKLLTALTSLDILNQEKEVKISQDVLNTEGSTGSLYLNQKLKTNDLLYPLLLTSSNDAAEAIASVQPRNYFMSQLNLKAKAIGMNDTSLDDPSGLSPLNVSTAEDLVTLIRYIHNYKSYILDITKEKEHKIGKNKWVNNSVFDSYASYEGGKTGFTPEAHKTYVGVFKAKLKTGETKDIVVSILNSESNKEDINKILNFLERHVEIIPFVEVAENSI
jgi:hypothetical protein